MSFARLSLVSAALLAACVGSDPSPSSPSAADAGTNDVDASTPANDAGSDTGNAGNDAGLDATGSFCTGRASAVCEDFEGVFPPGGWQQDKVNASWEATLGFESARGFASFHDAVATSAQALLYRDVTVTAAHKAIRIGARVRRVTYAAPETFMSVFYLRTNQAPDKFVTFALTASGNAAAVADSADGSTFVSASGAFADGWHSVVVEITRGASTTMTLDVDGTAIGSPVTIFPVADGARRLGIGLQSDASSGPRRLDLDDVFVDLVE